MARGRAAAAELRVVVIRLAVVQRQLLAGFDVAQCVDVDVAVRDAHETVWLARVVDVLRAVAAAAAVDAPLRIYRADVQAAFAAHAPRGFDARDALARQLGHLLSSAERYGRETALAVNLRLLNLYAVRKLPDAHFCLLPFTL